MGEPKPLASLSSSLLARKGHAKPAMRPQGFGGFGSSFSGNDDLGWNDMGHDRPHVAPVELEAEAPMFAPVPAVVRQREELVEELNGHVDPTSDDVETEIETPVLAVRSIVARSAAPVAVARAKKASKARNGVKAAFTLRLDTDRHLKLRLACAVTRESAQAIVTEALDQYLATFPEIDELARMAPGKTH